MVTGSRAVVVGMVHHGFSPDIKKTWTSFQLVAEMVVSSKSSRRMEVSHLQEEHYKTPCSSPTVELKIKGMAVHKDD